MAVDQDTRRAIDLVWEQGINVIRNDVQKLAATMQDAGNLARSAKRWFIGLVVTVVPSYIGLLVLWTKR